MTADRPGLSIGSRDLIALVRDKAAGCYLVPSFGRYDVIAELVPDIKR